METGYERFAKKSTTIRDNPIPGEETQVDFGEYSMKDMYGKKRKVYFMVTAEYPLTKISTSDIIICTYFIFARYL